MSSSSPTASPAALSAAEAAAAEAEVSAKLAEFNQGFQAKALQIVYEVLPTKLDSLQLILDKYKERKCDPPCFTKMGAKCNAGVQELIQAIKSELNSLLSLLDPIRQWISLNIPKMSDQKGTSVQVKEDLIDMLHSGKVSAIQLMESMCKYYCARAKLVSKAIKFPLAAEDHKRCIEDLDNKQFFLLLNMITDLKNNYALIYDMCLKNMEKLSRQQESDSYQSMY